MSYSNAVFYIDYENGNDSARSTITSVSFGNNGSGGVRGTKTSHGLVTGAVITVSSGVYADFWKITKITDDTFDLDTATYSSDSSSDVVPFGGMNWADAWKTITDGAKSSRIASGDICRIAKSPDPTSIGSATWTNLSKTITLAAAQNATVENCESGWSSANGSTVTHSSGDRKEGSYLVSLVLPASPVANTKYAYKTISSLDLSSYQRLSFWIRNNNYSIPGANTWKICLCSDTTGDTVIDTFYVPALGGNGRWTPLAITKDGGGNLSSGVQSIAIYTSSSPPSSAYTTYFDNFIACTTSGLNLTSLISKNSNAQGGSEAWYGIQSIVGTTVMLDNETVTVISDAKGYYGTTESVTTYKRETIKIPPASNTATCTFGTINDSGSSGNHIQFQGGYNTSSSNQDGETIFDGQNGMGIGATIQISRSYITVGHLAFCRFYYGMYFSGASTDINSLKFENILFISNCCYGLYFGQDTIANLTLGVAFINNSYTGLGTGACGWHAVFYGITKIYNNRYGIQTVGGSFLTFKGFDIKNSDYSVNHSGGVSLYSDLSMGAASNNDVNVGSAALAYFYNCIFGSTSEYGGNVWAMGAYSQKHDQTADNHWIFTPRGTINSQTSVRHTESGIAWRLYPNSQPSFNNPLFLSVAKIACAANHQVTVTIYMKKGHATNVAGWLICRGGQIAGVPNDVYDLKADDTNWEQLTIQFTPTEIGVVEILAEAWYVSGASYVYVDDIEISEAN